MSRHRVKDVGYDDDDYYSDDGYASPDPEEQEFLQQCTTAVLQQLGAGQSPVTATKEEAQEALWHYYNDIEKSVNYLRGKKQKEAAKQKPKTQAVPAFPAPPSTAAHFSAADFFRDCPWLNVPAHRKTDILIEPLYPRLGLLGGAPEAGGKVSKLAALAAARKKKEGAAPEASATPTSQSDRSEASSPAPGGATPSLRERLAASGKPATKPTENSGSLGRAAKPIASSTPPSAHKEPTTETKEPSATVVPLPTPQAADEEKEPERQESLPSIRATPSTFASTIVGTSASTVAEPSHSPPGSTDLLKIYGQNNAEPFDFAAPSPDDVVLNAQNTAKGLKSKTAPSKSTGDKKGQSELAGGMKDLSVEDKVTVKSKNLDVLAEYKKSTRKKSANFVVIGQYIAV
ncbi:unnamed protein product [Penicillium olsonii]|nr:unnamed protein product [Penicillium olsonii]